MAAPAPFVLAVDVGTSSLKAVVYDCQGSLLASASRRYETHSPQPGWAETDPNDWWEALTGTVQELNKRLDFSAIQAVGPPADVHRAGGMAL